MSNQYMGFGLDGKPLRFGLGGVVVEYAGQHQQPKWVDPPMAGLHVARSRQRKHFT